MPTLFCFSCSKYKDVSLFSDQTSTTRKKCKCCDEKYNTQKKSLKKRHANRNSKSFRDAYTNDRCFNYFKNHGIVD